EPTGSVEGLNEPQRECQVRLFHFPLLLSHTGLACVDVFQIRIVAHRHLQRHRTMNEVFIVIREGTTLFPLELNCTEHDTGLEYSFDGIVKSRSIKDLVRRHYVSPITCSSAARGILLLSTPVTIQPWIIARTDVLLGDKLGEGAFGEVFKGQLHLRGKNRPVAVKVVNTSVCKEALNDLIAEGLLMREISHKNLVATYGLCTVERTMIVMELAS
ncbi:hypothetical protein PFISCL1PPCAC_5797, partial [Pristionchus fissidentatus]